MKMYYVSENYSENRSRFFQPFIYLKTKVDSMALQLINEELFYTEFSLGEKKIKEKLCNFLGHDVAREEVRGEQFRIPKGICLRCGEGTRYFKCSKKETEDFKREMETLR